MNRIRIPGSLTSGSVAISISRDGVGKLARVSMLKKLTFVRHFLIQSVLSQMPNLKENRWLRLGFSVRLFYVASAFCRDRAANLMVSSAEERKISNGG